MMANGKETKSADARALGFRKPLRRDLFLNQSRNRLMEAMATMTRQG
jgi:hypothetical protein